MVMSAIRRRSLAVDKVNDGIAGTQPEPQIARVKVGYHYLVLFLYLLVRTYFVLRRGMKIASKDPIQQVYTVGVCLSSYPSFSFHHASQRQVHRPRAS